VKQYPYWLATLADDVTRRDGPTALPESVDVAVVGAGYTGLAAARQLRRAGASVAVLERERIGAGASSRNGGQVLTGLKRDPATLVRRFGASRARDLFGAAMDSLVELEGLIGEEQIDCEYVRCGHLQAAWKPSHFDALRREQELLDREFGHPVRLVDRADQGQELGSDRYFGLLVDERSGALHPARYVHGLAAAACRAGAVVYENCQVRQLARSASRWTVVTDRGDIGAGDVLMATDGYTDKAAPFLQRRLVPIGSYMIATAPLDAAAATAVLPRRRMAFDSKHFLYYFRLTSDDRLLFGGRAEFSRPTPHSTNRAARALHDGMIEVFPTLEGVPIEYAWSGNVGFTRDQMPHAGRIDGVWYAGGYCGHGVAMATYLGGLVARWMAGERLADHPLLNAPLPSIPLYNGTPWFLPIAGAWYRIRDFIE
jgi:glycine/D-amino acid oxidase-like deaminating enzyme